MPIGLSMGGLTVSLSLRPQALVARFGNWPFPRVLVLPPSLGDLLSNNQVWRGFVQAGGGFFIGVRFPQDPCEE